MSLITVPFTQLQAFAQAPGQATYDALILADAQEKAKSVLGFKNYGSIEEKRQVALTDPAFYLDARRIMIQGGEIPRTDTMNVATKKKWKALFGDLVEDNKNAPTPITGVAGEISDIYAKTLRELHRAGVNIDEA